MRGNSGRGQSEVHRPSKLEAWFNRRFQQPTPAQAAAWPLIAAGRNVLIASPTGTGKTFAAFFSILDRLAIEFETGVLRDTIHAVYVSPLRALNYDLDKNLTGPLHEVYGAQTPVRVALRTGDTAPIERQRQFAQPPHILLTTPESLCLLLSQEKWLPHLGSVRWVIVDEIHALAENKRGAHLAISLERLSQLACDTSRIAPAAPREPGAEPIEGKDPQRIGLSATLGSLAEAGRFLAGERPCEIVDAAAAKRIELCVFTPLQRNPYPPAGFSGVRLMGELGRLIRRHKTVLVFSNTRSGAESATFQLKQRLPDLADRIECHHASLDRDLRLDVEDRLKRGELRAVVCSTSLELGIDIGHIDRVVMLSTPKGVSKALQRTGRSGHNLHETSRGLLMATNVGDLVECCATVRLARAGHLDALRMPRAPLDVLAQHLMSMGCTRVWRRDDALELVRRAAPYRDLSVEEFDAVLDYLAGGGKSLRDQYEDVFGRIHLSETTFEARGGSARRDFLQNIGTIASEGVVQVRQGRRVLGTIEESFLRHLKPGDVFTLGGRAIRLEDMDSIECRVRGAEGAIPTVPRWNANKFPLANRVAREIRAFRKELRARLEAVRWEEAGRHLIPWIEQRLECGRNNAAIIFRIHAAQHQFSEIPTPDFLLVESLALTGMASPQPEAGTTRSSGSWTTGDVPPSHNYFFHSLIGRAANDAFSRVVALRLSRLRGGNAVATPDDYGFVLTLAAESRIEPGDFKALLSPAGFDADLDAALDRSLLLKHHFRNAAQTGLMVYRNYFGEQKSARKIQWSTDVIFNALVVHEPGHVLLREARRDARHSYLDAPRAEAYLADLAEHNRPVRLRTLECIPPLSFGMFASRMREPLMLEDPQESLERLYHHWWQKLEGSLDVAGSHPPAQTKANP